MEVIGTIKLINDEKQITDKFITREFILTTEDQYPQTLSLQLQQQAVDLIDPYKIGDRVKVSINLKGREWISPQNETKYFNTLEVWKIQPEN